MSTNQVKVRVKIVEVLGHYPSNMVYKVEIMEGKQAGKFANANWYFEQNASIPVPSIGDYACAKIIVDERGVKLFLHPLIKTNNEEFQGLSLEDFL